MIVSRTNQYYCRLIVLIICTFPSHRQVFAWKSMKQIAVSVFCQDAATYSTALVWNRGYAPALHLNAPFVTVALYWMISSPQKSQKEQMVEQQ